MVGSATPSPRPTHARAASTAGTVRPARATCAQQGPQRFTPRPSHGLCFGGPALAPSSTMFPKHAVLHPWFVRPTRAACAPAAPRRAVPRSRRGRRPHGPTCARATALAALSKPRTRRLQRRLARPAGAGALRSAARDAGTAVGVGHHCRRGRPRSAARAAQAGPPSLSRPLLYTTGGVARAPGGGGPRQGAPARRARSAAAATRARTTRSRTP